jgi:hypothetical protein
MTCLREAASAKTGYNDFAEEQVFSVKGLSCIEMSSF